MKYRKKPVVIEATQWKANGDHPDDRVGEIEVDQLSPDDRTKDYQRLEGAVVRFFRSANPEKGGKCHCKECGQIFHVHGWIDTKEGGHIVCPGDFIITGVKGERYPCKPDIFADTYDAVEPDALELGAVVRQREVGDQRILGDQPLGVGVSRR